MILIVRANTGIGYFMSYSDCIIIDIEDAFSQQAVERLISL